jgi:transcriptional regulator with GAF, ATPase, and Fis domain
MSRTAAENLAETFVELADTLVADFDLVDFLHLLVDRCVELLDVGAAGLLLADHNGELRVVAASSEQARLLELFELQNDEGPCLQCYRTGTAVRVADLDEVVQRWPRFATAARSAGFAAVHALPMRLRDDTIGALNLFRPDAGPLDRASVRIAQAMADVATIGLLQERAAREREALAGQLQTALNSRILIEQAKGVLAERLGIGIDQAFATIRCFARNHNQRLSDTARAVVEGSVDVAELKRLARGQAARGRWTSKRQPGP